MLSIYCTNLIFQCLNVLNKTKKYYILSLLLFSHLNSNKICSYSSGTIHFNKILNSQHRQKWKQFRVLSFIPYLNLKIATLKHSFFCQNTSHPQKEWKQTIILNHVNVPKSFLTKNLITKKGKIFSNSFKLFHRGDYLTKFMFIFALLDGSFTIFSLKNLTIKWQ